MPTAVPGSISPTWGNPGVWIQSLPSYPIYYDPATGGPFATQSQWKAETEVLAQQHPFVSLDVLYKISVHLEPGDVLNLARTSRVFRRILMSKSSTQCWRAARKNIDDLPDCPSFLSEPQYASLAFGRYCHNCLTQKSSTVRWVHRARLCWDCFPRLTIPEFHIRDSPVWRPMIPYLNLLPIHDSSILRTALGTDAQSLLSMAMQAQFGSDQQLRAQWSFCTELSEFAAQCARWEKKEIRRREARQLAGILRQLQALGWDYKLDLKPHLSCLRPCIARHGKECSANDLWLLVREPVVKYLTEQRNRRIQSALVKRFTDLRKFTHAWFRYDTQSALFPNPRDFASLPEVRAIIGVPGESDDTLSLLNSTLAHELPNVLSHWRWNAHQRFVRYLHSIEPQHKAAGLGTTQLAASVFFVCRKCHSPREHPAVLTHTCPRTCSAERNLGDKYDATADAVLGQERWQPEDFATCTPTIAYLVKLCGWDPLQTTIEQMDKLNARFSCSCCDEGSGIVSAMTWRTAALHCLQHHFGMPTDALISLLPIEDIWKAHAMEAAVEDKYIDWFYKSGNRKEWGCGLCGLAQPSTRLEINNHLQLSHGSLRPGESVYRRHPDMVPLYVDPVYFVSSDRSMEGLPQDVQDAFSVGMAEWRVFEVATPDLEPFSWLRDLDEEDMEDAVATI